MKVTPLLIAASALAFVAGCATATVSRVPVKTDAHFTIAHLEISQVDVPPQLPKYWPRGMGRSLLADEREDGYAIVQYIVDTEGIPREVQCVEASSALHARDAEMFYAQLRYRPARKAGKAVAVKVEQRIRSHGVLPPYAKFPSSLPLPANQFQSGL